MTKPGHNGRQDVHTNIDEQTSFEIQVTVIRELKDYNDNLIKQSSLVITADVAGNLEGIVKRHGLQSAQGVKAFRIIMAEQEMIDPTAVLALAR